MYGTCSPSVIQANSLIVDTAEDDQVLVKII
ncbi:MAG: hypothetical protein H6R42_978 [Nitrospirae bacterium]|nr:hypothetical protein [Nitrospirota bacterium]